MNYWLKQQKGYTLLELIFVMVLMGIFLTLATSAISRNAQWMTVTLREAFWEGKFHDAYRIMQKDFLHLRQRDIVFYHPRFVVIHRVSTGRVVYNIQRNTIYRNGKPLLSGVHSQNIFYLQDVKGRYVRNKYRAQYFEIHVQPQFNPHIKQVERFYVEG